MVCDDGGVMSCKLTRRCYIVPVARSWLVAVDLLHHAGYPYSAERLFSPESMPLCTDLKEKTYDEKVT